MIETDRLQIKLILNIFIIISRSYLLAFLLRVDLLYSIFLLAFDLVDDARVIILTFIVLSFLLA